MTVLLVHGVGVGPEAFGPIASGLAAGGIEATTVTRPGYGRDGGRDDGAVHLERQVDVIADLLALRPTHADNVWVGVSGGATLGLLAAERRPRIVDRVILHEPLAGSLTPEIHELVIEATERLERSDAEVAAVEFVERLVGVETWARLGPERRSQVASRADVIAREVREFVSYEADRAALTSSGVVITITVGARSSSARHRAAELVAAAVSGEVVRIPGAGHLPHVDTPDTYVSLIRSLL